MKEKRRSAEEIIRILRMADGQQAVERVCHEANISEQTFYLFERVATRISEIDGWS